jgi:hypothetical protein
MRVIPFFSTKVHNIFNIAPVVHNGITFERSELTFFTFEQGVWQDINDKDFLALSISCQVTNQLIS